MADERDARDAFEDQEDYDEIVEIGEDGTVYKPGDAPRSFGQKPSILRDPHGEYLHDKCTSQ